MIIYEGIGGVVLFLAMAVLAIYFYGRLCRDAGYEEGRGDRAQQELAERHAGRRTGRHELRAEPRRHPPRTALVQDGTASPDIPPAAPDGQAPPWETRLPGPGRPQAPRDSGPGTARLPRSGSISTLLDQLGVKPRLGLPATTGEIAAVTDQYISDMEADEAAFRVKLALAAGSE
jgi:Na+-transporting methylmalonyl-CoA/oxaloacetate decarboxylase gamma subunit